MFELVLKMDCSSLSEAQGYIMIHFSSNFTDTANEIKKDGLQSHVLLPAERLTSLSLEANKKLCNAASLEEQ